MRYLVEDEDTENDELGTWHVYCDDGTGYKLCGKFDTEGEAFDWITKQEGSAH